jgi:hypothetical protein
MWFSVSEYWAPLATVPSWEFDEYLDALETTLERRMEQVPEHSHSYSLDQGYKNQDVHAVERSMYHDLLEELDEIDTKTELMRYSKEKVETPESALPSPLDLLILPFDRMFESHRGKVMQDLFEEAKEELEPQETK